MAEQQSSIIAINEEITRELSDAAVQRTLLATTFNGLDEKRMRQAMLEGMIRGYTFKDFLQKNVYAIPYGARYSLVTSVDFARKRGMRSGIVGKSAPTYEMDGKQIVSCTVTVKRKEKGDEYVGDFTATVYFDEYTTNKNLWTSKPRTMIAKVAEMHALRMACPEELSQSYIEEEFEAEPQKLTPIVTGPATERTSHRPDLPATHVATPQPPKTPVQDVTEPEHKEPVVSIDTPTSPVGSDTPTPEEQKQILADELKESQQEHE